MKILLIQDDFKLAEALKDTLEKSGFTVECAYSGEDGIAYAETKIYDLAILEMELHPFRGCEIAKRIRENGIGTPILILTDQYEMDEEIEGLNAGADYYLTRPHCEERLLACIHALLRRQGPQVNELIVGDTTLNLANAILSCHDRQVRLSSKEFDVMRFLMYSQGQILSKELILCRVWGFNSNAVENHVEVYVGLLRKKLKQIGAGMTIKTVRSLGYVAEASGKE